uniref:Uncharacterized protein n=1 Tax=uncultured marine virus TaxID=186617 RepID=A0A0F7L6P7_9VIRU|nr:hypothetical protein [uncultured marine virus]
MAASFAAALMSGRGSVVSAVAIPAGTTTTGQPKAQPGTSRCAIAGVDSFGSASDMPPGNKSFAAFSMKSFETGAHGWNPIDWASA